MTCVSLYPSTFGGRSVRKYDASSHPIWQDTMRVSYPLSHPRSVPLVGLITLTLIMGLWASSVEATTYYVSTTGSDSNVGTSPVLPFRTIQQAAGLMHAGDTCIIRGGTYRETVTPANSGLVDAPITFEAYRGDRVIISGTDLVTARFAPYQGSLYRAPISWTMGKGKDQVFANGQVLPEARFPNTPSPGVATYPVQNLGPLWPPLGDFSTTSTTQVESPLLNGQAPGLWKGAIYNGMHWYAYQSQSADITDSAPGVLTITPASRKWYLSGDAWFIKRGDEEHGRGTISGVRAALDSPGEWINQNGFLYLWPPQGQDPNTIPIEVKHRQLAFDVTGKSHITIRNLEIVSASLTMLLASNCVVDGVKFSFVSQATLAPDIKANPRGENGIFLGGDHNTIKNSLIANSANACIIVTGLFHLITNNVIRDCGYSGGLNDSIIIGVNTALEPVGTEDRGGHVISYNTIYNSGRSNIGLGRHVYYYANTGRGKPTPFRKIRIVHNDLYNANLLSKDSGNFYTHGTSGGTDADPAEIAYNVIHDNLEPGPLGWGVYLDESSYNFNIHHNIIWLGRELVPNPYLQRGFDLTREATVQTGITFNSGAAGTPFPGGHRIQSNNKYKYDYHGGVNGLTDADFPDGQRFAFGASLPSSEGNGTNTFESGSDDDWLLSESQ